MKKIFLILFLILTIYTAVAKQEDILKQLNIPEKEFKSTKSISRYEIIEILNLADCFVCTNPASYQKKQLNWKWWEYFKKLPSSNFDDIFYPKTIYNWKNYYYCVAYWAKNEYIHWFPRQLSPICPWKYCWEKPATIADFFQITFNILSKNIYNKYSADWKKIYNWINSQDKNSNKYLYFNLKDLYILNNAYQNCSYWKCQIQSRDQFIVYTKYCTFNLKDCNFKNIWKLEEGTWPIAELNILIKEWIFKKNEIEKLDFNLFVPKKLVYQTFLRLKEKNKCKFDFDYDKDGIPNNKDNCINTYNPNQKDLDKDWIWNVCDDDIDGDGVKNPIWIVDWQDNIIISKKLEWIKKWKKIDNCLFIPNSNQKDVNKNWIWDACEFLSNVKALYITANPLEAYVWENIKFKAVTKWKIKNIQRDFWDLSQLKYWINTNHTYSKAWKYIVRATALFEDGTKKYASLTIKIKNIKNDLAFEAICNPLSGKKPLSTSCKAKYKWNIDKILRIFNNNDKRYTLPNKYIKKTFFKSWIYPVIAIAIKNNKPVAKSLLNIWVSPKILSSNLLADKLQAKINQPINFITKINGFTKKNIDFIFRDFGDWYKEKNNKLNLSYYYSNIWIKTVKQTIFLKDWTKLYNQLVLSIDDPNNIGKWIYLKAKMVLLRLKQKNFYN